MKLQEFPLTQEEQLRKLKRDIRNMRGHFRDLILACKVHIQNLDHEMKQPSDMERGKRIAKLTNKLEVQLDASRHFGLGEPLGKK